MVEPPALTGGPVLFGDRYQLGPVIGQGGMAQVRSGHDIRLDRPVAVKLLRRDVAHQPGVRSRFEAEARMAARLIHPNVVSVFDSGEFEGVPFIVMERLPGGTLGDRLAEGPMAVGDVEELAGQVLAALQAAHEAGIVHRDIKPGNVLAAPGRIWKVADFGIAKALELGGADLTATGLLIGTPAFLAPERFFGAPASVASDLYSLGVVLFQALAGRKPFDSDRLDAWAPLVSAVPAPPIASLRPDVGPALAAAVDRCLAKDPAHRFRSAAEMAASISGTLSPQSVAAPPTVRLARSGPGGDTQVLPRSNRFGRRVGAAVGQRTSRARLLAAAVAAAAVVVILVATLSSGGGPRGGANTTGTTGTTAVTATTYAGRTSSSTVSLPAALSRALDDLQRQVTSQP